jgi:hypothetical protein
MKLLGGIVLGSVLFAGQVSANITVKTYEEDKAAGGNQWNATRVYIDGVGAGLQSANAALRSGKQQPLFCEPLNFVITSENLLNILDQRIGKGSLSPMSEDLPIEIVLLIGLQKTFPCK